MQLLELEPTAGAPAEREIDIMLQWALAFFVLAIIAAIFGFGGIAAGAAGIAKILFYAFLVVFAITLVMGLIGRGGKSLP